MQKVESTQPEQQETQVATRTNEGFRVPLNIPGAPDKITFRELLSEIYDIVNASIQIFVFYQYDDYEREIDRASWWRLWLTLGSGAILAGVLFAIAEVFTQARFANLGLGYNALEPLMTLIFAPILIILALFGGSYLSHWYITGDRSDTSNILKHSYTVALVWLPSGLLISLLAALNIVLFGGFLSLEFFMRGGNELINALPVFVWFFPLLALYIHYRALRIMEDGIGYVHRASDFWLWVTLLIMLGGFNILYVLLNLLLPG